MVEVPEVQDRALSYLLANPEHMASLLRLTAPELALRVDSTTLVQQESTLIPEDLRKLVEDVLYEGVIDGDAELSVFVLVAHQSSADPLMALRLLRAMTRLYHNDQREQEERGAARSTQRLRRVIPLVVHTGRRPWSVPPLEELFERAAGLDRFVPCFEILPLDLAAIEEEALLSDGSALAFFLNLFRCQYQDSASFLASLKRSLEGLKAVAPDAVNLGTWLRFAFRFASLRRGLDERDSMIEVVKELLDEEDPEVVETIADAWRKEGREEGREEGHLEGLRALLSRMLSLRFPDRGEEELRQRLEAITEKQRLEDLGARLVTGAPSWDEFWA